MLDLRNILDFTLKFMFYVTPIFWSFESIDFSLKWVLELNPMQVILGSFRNCILYGQSPAYRRILLVILFSCVLVKIGYSMISKKEDEYARMI